MSSLDAIKKQKWFYEFTLPDGSVTESYLPIVARQIHITREKALRNWLVSNGDRFSDVLDISCHEGYFSIVLSDYFKYVTGIDRNPESLVKAMQIALAMGRTTIQFYESSVEDWVEKRAADFVLCFGLLYHVENPIQILRKLSLLTKKTLCIETQVLPFDFTGSVEDGSYKWQRDIMGLFGVCADYSHRAEGGLTDLALVPTVSGLVFLLKQFGFSSISFYEPSSDDYEQFVRKHRVILFASK